MPQATGSSSPWRRQACSANETTSRAGNPSNFDALTASSCSTFTRPAPHLDPNPSPIHIYFMLKTLPRPTFDQMPPHPQCARLLRQRGCHLVAPPRDRLMHSL